MRGRTMRGSAPEPRQGTSPLHPMAYEAVELVQTPAAQILAPQNCLAMIAARILAPEAQS